MSRQILDRLIESFSVNNLLTFFRNKFSGFEGVREDYSHYLNQKQSEKYTDVYKIGETTLNGHEHIIAITALTNDPLTERSGKKTQYDIARTILKSESADLAFFVFHDQEGNFRFSIIKIDRENNKAEYTTHRRYTYYVSKDQTNRTFRDQIGDAVFNSIADIVKAFSVEKLNKEFYDELSNWYFWATKVVVFPDDEEKREDIRNATSVIRLITRLIFVWFLKQKKLVPSELFDKSIIDEILNYSDKTGSTYYKAILQNLFFATLNTEMKEGNRKFVNRQPGVQAFYRYKRFFSDKNLFLQLTKDIPFLNGGLFENLDKNVGEENVIRIDCFSDRRDNEARLVVPDYLFFGETTGINLNDAYGDKKHTSENINGLIDILKRYNFTVEENNPLETEVALDPELLGKVFENLLASYNPETKTTARKQSGSFYTPREIVDYMCEESLFVYLKEATNGSIDEEKLRILIAYNDKIPEFTDDEKRLLIKSIDKCRILDPACGSGAFPMGALQKMVFILQKLDPENKQWRKRQEERARKENKELIENLEKDRNLVSQIESLPEIKKQALNELDLRLQQIDSAFTLSTNELDYARKLFLIENCIFGVDIQPIAIQISKLRFFISLLVEQRVDDSHENKGVIPMPNMETKFVAANTLVGLSLENSRHLLDMSDPVLNKMRNDLQEIRHKHFSARTTAKKKKCRKEDKELRNDIKNYLIRITTKPNEEIINQLNSYIDELKEEQRKYIGERWVHDIQKEEVQTSFLDPVETYQPKDVVIDKNKQERDKIDKKISEIQRQILKEKNKGKIKGLEAEFEKIADWNPYDQNATAGWFDPEWMFGFNNGFDIVIGNPPYIQLQKNGGELAKKYEKSKFDTFERTGDIYSLFYEKGVSLLAEKRFLIYITSNKWMRANYGASTRMFFAEKTEPLLLIDFGNVQVFETATVDTNILLVKKRSKGRKILGEELIAVRMNKDLDRKNIALFVKENGYTLPSLNENAWVVGEKDEFNIKEYVEKQGVPLQKWGIEIFRGILTGYNDAFIVPGKIKDKLIKDDSKSKELLKPLLRGKDISAWYPDFQDQWLINSHNGIKSQKVKRIEVEKNYPAIYNWLYGYKDKLEKRTDKGDHWTNLRNCVYLNEFEKPKIIYPNMTKYMPFVYDESGIYTNQKCFILTGQYLKYLTCFFNSKLFKYCFSDNFPELQGGTRELSKVFFDKIPVKQITHADELPFSIITDYLVALKKENSEEATDQLILSYFEQIANALIFEYYFTEHFERRNLYMASYFSQLPILQPDSNILIQLRKIYVDISKLDHPIRQTLFNMQAIPQVELIIKSQL